MSDVTIPLRMLGEPSAIVCEGDACVVPDPSDQVTVNRRLDADEV